MGLKTAAVATPWPPTTTFTVLRITKLKTWDALTIAGQEPGKLLAGHAGSGTIVAAVRALIGQQTIRTNAVLAVQVLMSIEHGTSAVGCAWSGDSLQAWSDSSMSWLLGKYGNRVVTASLSSEGPVPAIVSILVPLDENGKLNARALFGGARLRLAQLQSEYAASVEELGIKRGGQAARVSAEVATLREQLQTALQEKAALVNQLNQAEGRKGNSPLPREEEFRAELERRGQVRLVP
ncbi:plasmid recombination protein (plasmid) [Cupriavidus pinatubonensis]|uniref:plasmid recombination protein n=1 Tax=Cupriavidus pinatubonensis TaxID=248026 RepID=UPI001C734708|nr:plasmid recombination protein [Cupriavidus pinatubonensis]QYY33583.1 plasmid recombination protein [Cupriavidus pinatubonensis]